MDVMRYYFRMMLLILFVSIQSLTAQRISKEKKYVLEWLGQPEVFEKYGKISDSIWSYAELGLQEFKSSKLLADNLEMRLLYQPTLLLPHIRHVYFLG